MKSFEKFLTAMMGDNLTETGRMWARVGIVVLVVAGLMSWSFGNEISWKHGAFLACLSFVTAFGPEAAYKAWHSDKRGPACAIAIACLPLLAIEFYSHAGWTAGIRGSDIETAAVQNAKWSGAQDGVAEDKASVALWKQQLTALLEQNAWAGTVKADGLRSELETLRARIEEEKKGKRGRKAGCGKECERLQDQANAVESRIAVAEQASDLAKRIEATQRVLDSKRDTAAVTEHKSSAVAHQNAFLAKAVTLVSTGSLEPTPHTKAAAEQSANLVMAIAATGMPAFCLFVAGLYRRPDDVGILQSSPANLRNSPSHATAHHSHAEPQPSHVQAEVASNLLKDRVEPTPDMMQPINITLPVNVHHDTPAPIQAPVPLERRVIGHVRDTAFARRVEQATRAYRHGGATA